MLVRAKSKYIRISPYKVRPIIDVVRGYSLDQALAWLKTYSVKRVRPVIKTLISAYSNGKNLNKDVASLSDFYIKEIRIDQGPIFRYFKPGAMGRASVQRKRLSHIEVVLELKNKKVENKIEAKIK